MPDPGSRRLVRAARPLAGVVVALALAAALGSCGADDSSPSGDETSASADPSPSGNETSATNEPSPSSEETSASEEPVVIDITIANGNVTPAGEQVEAAVDQEIELHVDSDAADELHVHSSPEHEFAVKPVGDQVFTFSINQPGQVEIETHETETVIAELVVS